MFISREKTLASTLCVYHQQNRNREIEVRIVDVLRGLNNNIFANLNYLFDLAYDLFEVEADLFDVEDNYIQLERHCGVIRSQIGTSKDRTLKTGALSMEKPFNDRMRVFRASKMPLRTVVTECITWRRNESAEILAVMMSNATIRPWQTVMISQSVRQQNDSRVIGKPAIVHRWTGSSSTQERHTRITSNTVASSSLQEEVAEARVYSTRDRGLPFGSNAQDTSGSFTQRTTMLAFLKALSPFLFFSPSLAQAMPLPSNKPRADWKVRALGALTDNLVACAYLLAPAIALLITGGAAIHFRKSKKEGHAAISMCIVAILLITIRSPSNTATSDGDRYIRPTLALAYTFFMLVYCKLVARRNRWHSGSCTIVVAVGLLMALMGIAITPIRTYWLALTQADPLFASSPTIPSAFWLCNLVVHISDRLNGRGRAEEAGVLPAPVPGPR